MNRRVRGALRVVSLALVAASLALGVSHAMPVPSDTSGIPDLALHPSAPCTDDVVTVFVRGYVATPCDSFLSAERIDDRTIRVRTLVYSTRQCLAAPWQFLSIPVVMGRFPAGPNEIRVLRETLVRDEIATRDTVRSTSTLSFTVGTTCSAETMPAITLPFVDSVTTVPSPACPGGPVAVRLAGAFLDGCGRVVSVDPSTLSLTLAPDPPTGPCTLAPRPWSAEFPLGRLAAGHYAVSIHMTVLGNGAVSPPIPTQTYVGVFEFDVPFDCVGGMLPYVSEVRIGPARTQGVGPICPGDSIEVRIRGILPSDCFRANLEAIDPPYASPIPMPPILRLNVMDQGCTRRACGTDPVPFERIVHIGPLFSGSHTLWMEELRTLGCPPVLDSHRASATFDVAPAESCGTPSDCLHATWLGSGSDSCTAFIPPGDSSSVVLALVSPVALAGLEGHLRLSGIGAVISDLEPVGPAAGMVLRWTRTTDGVHFLLFAKEGAPIPPTPPLAPAMVPVLKVTVALVARPAHDPLPTRLALTTGWDLLGSDVSGHAVPLCGPAPWEFRLPPTAVFCIQDAQCDWNSDGLLDVRDLVLMVHCALDPASCQPDLSRFDCDRNGAFDVEDVLCCAAELLRGPGCPECPADSVRAAPEISVRFGSPRSSGGGIELPVLVSGAASIGATHLRFRFPADRLEVAGVDAHATWLELHRTSGNELSLGLVESGAVTTALLMEEPIELIVRLTPRPGFREGGDVALIGAEFSGRDGVKLAVDVGTPTVALGPVGAVQMTAAHPNPFEASTRFSVQLARAAALDVGVYDLAGRRVATVFHGTALAGARSFTWNGATDQGGQARGGVYFVRALTEGGSVSRRVILVRGR